eukprot:1810971-Amphidinium_carterae.1
MQHICEFPGLTRALCARCGAFHRLRQTKAWHSGHDRMTLTSFDLERVRGSVKSVHDHYNTLARIGESIEMP